MKRGVSMKEPIEVLRGLREDKDLKQSDIADLIKTTQQQYSKYETGESELPTRVLTILADFYGVSTDYILGRTTCREGVSGLNVKLTADYPVGSLISDVLSLSKSGQASVIEYVGLQKIKEKRTKK
jgi:transcriptional regulator with XRE-family HTH domain